ncbi:helix-turn-helix domain-containing protein [Mesobacillus harenae]|uniref:helix-turn-helix domain-containing protein n=1 Tax=Mesobacillus harenae TaxID=2213203 RepID=UPI0015804661|nr:helix-turn-helix domain-containing protein [Mesobacillus harenae]
MVGERIKRLRVQKKYSINELADKAGISKSYLSYIERGIQENPSLQVLSRLARSLNTSVEDLMGTTGNETDFDPNVDKEWLHLIDEAIEHGISKEQFSFYLDFIKFRNRGEIE